MAEFCLQSCTKVRSSVNFCGSMVLPRRARCSHRYGFSPGGTTGTPNLLPPQAGLAVTCRKVQRLPHALWQPSRGGGELLPLLPLYSPHAAEAPPLLPRLLTNRPYCPSFGSGVQNLLEMKVGLPSGLPLSVAFGLTLFSFDSVHERMPVKVIAVHSSVLVLS